MRKKLGKWGTRIKTLKKQGYMLMMPEINNSQLISIVPGLKINIDTKEIYVDQKPVELAPVEYTILRTLVRNRNITISKSELIKKMDEEKSSELSLRVRIHEIRKKLGKYSPIIKSVIGDGYILYHN